MEFETICKGKKEKIICERRNFSQVDTKSQKDIIWMVWDLFLVEATKRSKFIKNMIAEFPDLKFDYILANPHFNDSDWDGEDYENDVRWVYGRPSVSNANYAWLQHILWKLKKTEVDLKKLSLPSML